MEKTSLKHLCIALITALKEERLSFGKTRLIKLVYLMELLYYRMLRERLTDIVWIYHYYGPYSKDFEDVFSDPVFIIEDEDTFTKISIESFAEKPKLNSSVSSLVRKVVKKFGGLPLSDLLDYVYYDTEPMMNVESRGETLDFSTSEPEDYFKVVPIVLSESDKRRIKRKFSQRQKHG